MSQTFQVGPARYPRHILVFRGKLLFSFDTAVFISLNGLLIDCLLTGRSFYRELFESDEAAR